MPPKKKLSKKEKARIEAEQAEVLRIEQEKEKLRKLEEERERKLREREEAEKRQEQEIAENKIRRSQLKESMKYFDEINVIIDSIKIESKQKLEWNEYMRCNGLPNAQYPGDLRKYLHMWCENIAERNRYERNWLLNTDERTLLHQDLDIMDLSRRTLRKQQGNLGDIYSQRIREMLGILTEMDIALRNENISESNLIDLRRLKLQIRTLLKDYIDDFTCRILTHIDRDMELIKPGVSKHDYTSDVLKSQILAMQSDIQTKDPKIRIDEPRHTEIDFPLLELQLSLPPAVKIRNSSIRGLWLSYDHFSDNCCSFYLPLVKNNQLNILLQTKKEWKKRKEIILTTLEETTKVVQPESIFDSVEKEDPSPIDVDKVYSEYEDEMNKKRRRAIGAEVLNLGEFEVNLRHHRIVGGVYCIDYLEQPQQDKRINSRSFIRTIKKPDKIISKKFYQSYQPPPAPLPGVRRLPEEIEAEMRLIERNLDKLAMVTLQLPSTVLWFEPPVVCRWETQAEFEESENETPRPLSSSTTNATTSPSGSAQQSPRKSTASLIPQAKKMSTVSELKSNENVSRKPSCRSYKSTSGMGSISIHGLPVKEVVDFDLCNIPPTLDIFGLTTDFLTPRLPDGYCIRLEKEEVKEKSTNLLCLARYFETDEDTEKEKILKKEKLKREMCESIKEKLILTDSPRPFCPVVNFKKVLKVQPSPNSKQTIVRFEEEEQDDDKDENYASASNSYMFSQLLEDLDQLCELNMPVEDISVDTISKISTPTNSLPTSPTRKFSGIIIVRDNDPTEKLKTDNDDDDEEESVSEYNDEEDEEILSGGDLTLNDEKNGKTKKEIFGRWSTRDVHDAKFNEDKFTIQFRTGRLGFFGFASNRYSNMPYQTWEIKPDLKLPGTINFSLTAAVVSIEMSITKDGFCVNTFQGGTTDRITEMIGKYLSLNEMKSILQSSGVDLFPDEDAFCYTEGSCEKNYVMEMHLYQCMSTLGLSHNFSWSRWNLLSGSRVVVLLMRELIDNKKVPNHSTLYVTPLKASVVDCTEVSASFTTAGVQGMEYYADLHQLTLVHANPLSKEKQRTMNPVLRDNVAEILKTTRPLSFC